MAELIQMPFRWRTRVGPRNHVLDVCAESWTDRFAIYVVDSGGPKEAQF